MTTETPLFVVVATTRREREMCTLLDNLLNSAIPGGYRGLIAVENGEKGSLEQALLAAKYAELRPRYLYEPMPSKSNALNLALSHIEEQDAVLLFFDDDILVSPRLLRLFSEKLAQFGPGHYFGGPVERRVGSAVPSSWMVPLLPLSVLGWAPMHTGDNTVFLGCNWAAYKSDLEAAGRFDLRFGPGAKTGATGQETNMQERLCRNGCRSVYVEDALVAHRVGRESVSIRWLLKRRFRGGVQRGLLGSHSVTEYNRSYRADAGLNVIDPQVKLLGIAYVKYRVVRALAAIWSMAGKIHGERSQ